MKEKRRILLPEPILNISGEKRENCKKKAARKSRLFDHYSTCDSKAQNKIICAIVFN